MAPTTSSGSVPQIFPWSISLAGLTLSVRVMNHQMMIMSSKVLSQFLQSDVGSCRVEYTLDLTAKGMQKYNAETYQIQNPPTFFSVAFTWMLDSLFLPVSRPFSFLLGWFAIYVLLRYVILPCLRECGKREGGSGSYDRGSSGDGSYDSSGYGGTSVS
jgi:hypothetical protein